MPMTRAAVTLVLIVAFAPLRAAEPEPLTPDDAVALALERHPALRAAGRAVEAAQADRKLANSGYMPRLDLQEEIGRSTNPVFVFASKLGQERFGPTDLDFDTLNHPDPLTNAATRVTLRQNVWDGGRTILYRKAAGYGEEAAEAERARTRDEVAYRALEAFWNAVLATEMVEVARRAEEAAGAGVALAEALVAEGAAVPSDALQARVRLSEVRAMRVRAVEGETVARAALRLALGLSEDRTFVLKPPETPRTGVEPGAEAVVDRALAARPDLRAIDRRIDQARLGEKIARSGWYPEIGVGAAYEWNADRPFGHDGDNWSVGASIRIPIFEGLESRARLARATAERSRAEAFREAMAEGVRLEVRAARAEVISADERLTLAESVLAFAEDALRIVGERYREGAAIVAELLGAEAARTAAEGNRASARRDAALARERLALAAGDPRTIPTDGTLEATR